LEEDLDLFFNTFQPTLAGRRPTVVPIDGGYLQTDFKISPFNLEADLDFEYAMALTEPLDITNIQVGDKFRLGNINNMLAAFDSYYCGTIDPSIDPLFPDPLPGGYNQSAECGTVIPPKVLSISYGDPESEFPPEYLRRQCLEFLKLGLMGVTVTVGSGDDGSQSGSHDACIDPATGVSNASTGIFSPLWPASCPWVTSVGGTQRITQPSSLSTRSVIAQEADLSKANAFVAKFSSTINTNNNTVETALNTTLGSRIINSGGGFSNVFSTPYYQDKAVAEYRVNEKENLELVNHVHNQHGRGFPDVSALAAAYLTAVDGQIKTVYGTSASAPVFASVIAIINNERLHAGKRPVGFINPTLYAHPEIFTDITTGSNQGCGFTPAFRAAKGWDPVTGLGTPQYHRMLELFLSLP
jgi:tripeptidyl-peptidase-1